MFGLGLGFLFLSSSLLLRSYFLSELGFLSFFFFELCPKRSKFIGSIIVSFGNGGLALIVANKLASVFKGGC